MKRLARFLAFWGGYIGLLLLVVMVAAASPWAGIALVLIVAAVAGRL